MKWFYLLLFILISTKESHATPVLYTNLPHSNFIKNNGHLYQIKPCNSMDHFLAFKTQATTISESSFSFCKSGSLEYTKNGEIVKYYKVENAVSKLEEYLKINTILNILLYSIQSEESQKLSQILSDKYKSHFYSIKSPSPPPESFRYDILLLYLPCYDIKQVLSYTSISNKIIIILNPIVECMNNVIEDNITNNNNKIYIIWRDNKKEDLTENYSYINTILNIDDNSYTYNLYKWNENTHSWKYSNDNGLNNEITTRQLYIYI